MFLFVAKEISKSKKIDKIIISSDCNKIKKAKKNNFIFVKRPKKLTLENENKMLLFTQLSKFLIKAKTRHCHFTSGKFSRIKI